MTIFGPFGAHFDGVRKCHEACDVCGCSGGAKQLRPLTNDVWYH